MDYTTPSQLRRCFMLTESVRLDQAVRNCRSSELYHDQNASLDVDFELHLKPSACGMSNGLTHSVSAVCAYQSS